MLIGFEVILLARNFDLTEWADALEEGAFDVIDALDELPRAAGVVRRALWAAYLSGGQSAKGGLIRVVRTIVQERPVVVDGFTVLGA